MKYNFQTPSGWAQANPSSDAQTDTLRSKILYLEDRVKSTEKSLKNFKTRLQEATASLESRLEYLATLPGPLDKLPPEILSSILVEAAKSSKSFFYLLHINRRIRLVAFSTPALWQDVQFLGPSSPPKTLNIRSWISRAGILPLRVSSVAMPWKDNDLRSALSLGNDRIVEIDLQAVDLYNLIPSPVAGFTNLRRLSLENRQCWPHLLRGSYVSLISDCPKLTSVSLHFPKVTINLTRFVLPWHQLTNLSLSFLTSPEKILDILSQCTELRKLDLHFDRWDTLAAYGDNSIRLPLLTSLSLESSCPGETLPCFFEHLRAPSLNTLSVVFDDEDSSLMPYLETFVLGCVLADLSLTLSNWQEDKVLGDVFFCLQSLRSLTLKFEHTECIDEFIKRLSPHYLFKTSESFLDLPVLEKFELWAEKDAVNLEALKELRKLRTSSVILKMGAEAILSQFRVWTRGINIYTGREMYELSIAMGDGME